jgi:hypothetical protein
MASGSQENAPTRTAVDITLNRRSTHRTEKLCSSRMFVDPEWRLHRVSRPPAAKPNIRLG